MVIVQLVIVIPLSILFNHNASYIGETFVIEVLSGSGNAQLIHIKSSAHHHAPLYAVGIMGAVNAVVKW